MKFYELTTLFKDVIQNVKDNNKDNQSLRYIINAYNNVYKILENSYSDNEIVTLDKIDKLNISDHMKKKIITISSTTINKKDSDRIKESYKINKLKKELSELLGLGDKKINELVQAGLTSIKQLDSKKWFDLLNLDTQMSIVHKPCRSIPYEDIKKIEHLITGYRNDIMIVGSYRRKKPFIRDIDILFTIFDNQPSKVKNSDKNKDKNKNKNSDKIIKQSDDETLYTDTMKYINYLRSVFDNKLWFYSEGPNKASFIFQPNSNKNIKYKADIFFATPETYYSMLLYSTGSQANNIKMRRKAKNMGLLLNQNGIYKTDVDATGKRIITKKLNKPNDDERKLFKILDMEYLEPENRF